MDHGVSLDELVSAMAARGAPLQPETALFVVLVALETAKGPSRVVGAEDLRIDEHGGVTVSESAPVAEDEASLVESMVGVLESVLVPTPGSVVELATKVRGGALATRAGVVAELQAMLVPLNRAAAGRQVGRLVREHARMRLQPSEDGVSSASDTLLDGTPLTVSRADAVLAPVVDESQLREVGEAPAPKPARKGSPVWLAVVVLFLSMAAVGASAMYLAARLRGR